MKTTKELFKKHATNSTCRIGTDDNDAMADYDFVRALDEHREEIIEMIFKYIYSTHEYLDAWQQERLVAELKNKLEMK